MAAEPSAGDLGPPAGDRAPLDVPRRRDGAPVLFDGSEGGRLLPQLLDRLSDRALDRVDMAVSFVMKSGLARIVGPLEDALDRGAQVRVLTTDYLAITDPDALTQLADLASGPDRRLEVRLFIGGSVAFHPKAYIFWSSAGGTAAGYVGSSNRWHRRRSGMEPGHRPGGTARGGLRVTVDRRAFDTTRCNHTQRLSPEVAGEHPRRCPIR